MDFTFGIGEVASSLMNNLFSRAQAKQQFEYDKQMAAIQNQYNIDMWQRQNEYNTPTAQMRRLTDAGLSPMLAYGNVSTGNASSAPAQVAPRQIAPEQKVNLSLNASANLLNLMTLKERAHQEQLRTRQMLEQNRKLSWQERLLNLAMTNKLAETSGRADLYGGDFVFGEGGINQSGFDNLARYYTEYNKQNLHRMLFGNRLNVTRNDLIKAQNAYQNMVNDWFKIDRIFNYSTRAVDTVIRSAGAVRGFMHTPSMQQAYRNTYINNYNY